MPSLWLPTDPLYKSHRYTGGAGRRSETLLPYHRSIVLEGVSEVNYDLAIFDKMPFCELDLYVFAQA